MSEDDCKCSRGNINDEKRKPTSSEPRKKKEISTGSARRSKASGFLGLGRLRTEMSPDEVWNNPKSSGYNLLHSNRDLGIFLLLLLL